MLRHVMRVLLSPVAIALFDILIASPLVLSIFDVSRDLWLGHDIREPLDIVEGMGVILIGWGVALEERAALRDIFGLTGAANETWQAHVDHSCHRTGIGSLIFGLFAEMSIEIIRLPNRIINTEGINEVLVGVSVFFMAICTFILVRHVVVLLIPMHRH